MKLVEVERVLTIRFVADIVWFGKSFHGLGRNLHSPNAP